MDRATMIRVMRKIRLQYEQAQLPPWNPAVPNIYYEETNFQGKLYTLPLVILKTKPCRWIRVDGGCTTCNYQAIASLRESQEITDELIVAQVQWALEKLQPRERYPFLHVTSSGSFMDPVEVPEATRLHIARMLRENGVRVWAFESRPEFLTDVGKLTALVREFAGDLSVGIGLESSDDFVRNVCINKGYPIEMFFRAAESLKASGALFYTYVLLGKPFLSPKEDVEDAVQTIRFSFQQGARICLLMVTNLQPYTLVYWLWERGLYRLPSLWAPLEVLRLLAPSERSRVIIKAVDKAIPTPQAFATTCPECSDRVLKAITAWDTSGDYAELEAVRGTCKCETEWLKECLEDWAEKRNEIFSHLIKDLAT